MGIEFKKPLIIGDVDASVKSDISQIKQDIGDLSQLDTADKSSLVNALNEAIDSTLNGASRDLDNLSDIGNDKLRSLNAYDNNGNLLSDEKGLECVTAYSHSTFDLSKFTVVGSPIITDDGVASGFSRSNYITLPMNANSLADKSFKIFLRQQYISSSLTQGFKGLLFGSKFPMRGFFGFNGWGSSSSNYYRLGLWAGETQIITQTFDNLGVQEGDWVNMLIDFDVKTNTYKLYTSLNDNSLTLYNSVISSTLINTDSRSLELSCSNGNGEKESNSMPIDLKQFSITVDGVEVFSGNKTGIDIIKPDDYTVVGTPTISADGVASGFSGTGYIQSSFTMPTTNKFEIALKLKTGVINDSIQILLVDKGTYTGTDQTFNLNISNTNKFTFRAYTYGTSTAVLSLESDITAQSNTEYYLKVVSDGSYYKMFYSLNGINYTLTASQESDFVLTGATNTIRIGSQNHSTYGFPFLGSIDFNAFKIYVDGNLVYQPCLKIPYTESKTGSKIVSSTYRDRVADMSAQFGYANYYTLDEDNGNFTLPQVELYGLIERQNFAPSNKYKELTLGASGDTYVAPADGWFVFAKTASGNSPQILRLTNLTNGLHSAVFTETNTVGLSIFIPVAKNDIVQANYSFAGATDDFRFVYAKGSESEAS